MKERAIFAPPRNGEGDQPKAGGGAGSEADGAAVLAALRPLHHALARAVPLPVPGRS